MNDKILNPESALGLRKPTNTDDEKFITNIDATYQAAKLRNFSTDTNTDKYHTPISFSWSAFWKSLIYENLPPVFFSPLAALILEKSPSRAWHVIQNRGLCAVSTKHHPLSFILQSWLIIYPGSWLMTSGLLLAIFSEQSLVVNIDQFQMILAYLFLFMRRFIIAVKYGYFRPEDLERLCEPPPDWDNQKTMRRLVGRGWMNFPEFPGMIEDEMTVSMDQNDICLQAIPFEIDSDTAKKLKDNESSHLFPPQTSATKNNEITSGFFLYNIIKPVYNRMFPRSGILTLFICMIAIPLTPFIVKYFYEVTLFGMNSIEKIISSAVLIGFLIGHQLLMFGITCSIDYQRRYLTFETLGKLITYPGLAINELFKNTDKKDSTIFIDLQKRANVFAWMNVRKVLRTFGEAFYLRIQSYTSILIFYSMFCVGVLNFIVWTEMRHHISTMYVIGVIISIIAGISLHAIFKAINLQSLSAKHRDFIRKELFIIEEEIWELKMNDPDTEKIRELESAKALLQQVDESINYNELIYKPTTIVGYTANNSVIGSILGLVLTGVLFAIQGFVSTGISYDGNGWFGF
tara:strand:+ start:375 stop:2096 length:1722 start_codon:yes stop_codon:yes gene_type:complete